MTESVQKFYKFMNDGHWQDFVKISQQLVI